MAFLVYTDVGGELGAFADSGPRGREGLAALPLLSRSWVPCPALPPPTDVPPPPSPSAPRGHSLRARALPKSGEIVGTLGHTLAGRWDSR